MQFNFKFDKLLQHEVRLGIMSALMVNDQMDYNAMKQLLGLTDGNLASNINQLEKHDYITVYKEFVGKKPKTSYAATETGKLAFKQHLQALENFLNTQQ